MSALSAHLTVLPIVLPLVAAALLLVLGDRRRRLKSVVNVTATATNLLVAVMLLASVDQGAGAGLIRVYLAGNWQAPFGIVLVADRFSALMVVLAGVVGLCSSLYAEAAWARASVYFHPLFQIQLMGLNGAFLTGDLFNLFVFFEVMLAASYGLQLHGSGWQRVRSGMHYIAVNLLASALFLIGLSVLYGVLGTLSMADVAVKMALVAERDRGLMHAAAAILAVAFLIKAAMWPLNAWLVPAYSAASAPVAALFAIMTKVGVYVLLRLWTLFFSSAVGSSAQLGGSVLLYGGLATLAFGALGVVASLRLVRIASFSIIVSSGTLLAALGLAVTSVTAAALYYMLSATLAVSALFLLVELVERPVAAGRTQLPDVDVIPGEDTNLDDEEKPMVGRAITISMALLGLLFMTCAVLVAGLPPLSGFLAKLSLLSAMVRAESGAEAAHDGAMAVGAWVTIALLLVSGLFATVSLARAGIRHFWAGGSRFSPSLKAVEAVAVSTLVATCFGLTVGAERVMRYTTAAAAGLHTPAPYIDAVLSAKPKPSPNQTPITETAP